MPVLEPFSEVANVYYNQQNAWKDADGLDKTFILADAAVEALAIFVTDRALKGILMAYSAGFKAAQLVNDRVEVMTQFTLFKQMQNKADNRVYQIFALMVII